jgi:dihydroxy-acid dehydratase
VRRLEDFQSPPVPAQGYKALYRRTLTQAPEGCDFDFLVKPPRHD